jgi:hypothetical protein
VQLQTITGDVLTLTGFVVLSEDFVVFILKDFVVGGGRLPSGNLSFAKRTLVGWISGG